MRGVRLVLAACVHALDLRCKVHGLSAGVGGAQHGVPNAAVPALAPLDSVCDRARPDGWRERADGRAASALVIGKPPGIQAPPHPLTWVTVTRAVPRHGPCSEAESTTTSRARREQTACTPPRIP